MAWEWNIAGFPSIVNFAVAASTAAVVFLARPSVPLNRRFGLFLWAAALANLAFGLALFSAVPADASAYMAGNYLATLFAFAALWLFAAAVRGTGLGWLDRPWPRRMFYAAPLTICSAMLAGVLAAPQVRPGPTGASISLPGWWAAVGMLLTASAAGVALLFVLAWRRAPPDGARRAQARMLAIAMGVYLVLLVAANLGQLGSSAWRASDLVLWSYTPPYVALATLAGYGILRHQLFDIDLKIKFAVEKSTIAAVFAVAFLVASELVERLIGLESLWFGVAGAVLIGLVFRRVERLGEAVADRILPGVEDTVEYRGWRARVIYQAAVESAIHDGKITDRERDVLATLADQLGLSAGDVRGIERELSQGTVA